MIVGEPIYTVNQVAEILKVSANEIRKLLRLHQLGYFEVGEEGSKKKRKRIRHSDVCNYVNKNSIEEWIGSDKEWQKKD